MFLEHTMSLTRMLAAAMAVATLTLALSSAALAQDPPGFGDNNLAQPTGTPFVLPEGLEVTIVSYNPFDIENSCKHPDAPEGTPPPRVQGQEGGYVRLCLIFRNSTGGPINIEFPPGLIFISSHDKTQHGLLFQGLEIEVPSDQPMVSLMNADCMNVSLSAPGVGVSYALGPVTDNEDIREALGLMAGANISDPMVAATASMLMKPLYKGKPLTNDTRRQLMELPRRQG